LQVDDEFGLDAARKNDRCVIDEKLGGVLWVASCAVA